MAKPGNRNHRLGTLYGGVLLLLLTPLGCALIENPSVDELYGQGRVVTPSAEAVLAADVSPTSRHRTYETMARHEADGRVTHGALYFQDGLEKSAMNDDQFRWSGQDQIAFPLGVGRYLMNFALFPISVLKTPPGVVMISDGRSAWPMSDRT